MYDRKLMRTALTLAVVAQGEFRLLGLCHRQQVYSSIGLQLCLCVQVNIVIFCCFLSDNYCNLKLLVKQPVTNGDQ